LKIKKKIFLNFYPFPSFSDNNCFNSCRSISTFICCPQSLFSFYFIPSIKGLVSLNKFFSFSKSSSFDWWIYWCFTWTDAFIWL